MLAGIEVVQMVDGEVPPVLLNAVDFAGQMAVQLGAVVYVQDEFASGDDFLGRGKLKVPAELDLSSTRPRERILLIATTDKTYTPASGNAVVVHSEPHANEATIFAQSGLSDLLGDPDRAPIIPWGNFAAGTAAYGILAALSGLVTKTRRMGLTDVATVDLIDVLSWVNWKAAAAGMMGKDIRRQGDKDEWPIVPCADGHVALVYQARDWPQIIAMVGDERLEEERFASFKGRAQYREDWLEVLSAWASTRSKAEIQQEFLRREIPPAPVSQPCWQIWVPRR